jgi:hypothetical protein
MLTMVLLRSLTAMRPDELERWLRQRLDALGPAPRAELLHVLMLPDFERADRSASSGATPPKTDGISSQCGRRKSDLLR